MMMNKHHAALRVLALLSTIAALAAWAAAAAEETAAAEAQPFTVAWEGKLMRVHREGDARPRVSLKEAMADEGAFAIGPLAGLRGEITVLDGEAHIARVMDGKETVTHDTDQQAPFLVYGQVNAWQEVSLPAHVKDIGGLEAWLPEAAKERGLDPEGPFPFKLEAEDATIRYHIISNTAPGYTTQEPHHDLMTFLELDGAPANLVGVYSTQHGGVFTHHGAPTHIHMVSRDKRHAGHVDELELKQATRLFLPKLSNP